MAGDATQGISDIETQWRKEDGRSPIIIWEEEKRVNPLMQGGLGGAS